MESTTTSRMYNLMLGEDEDLERRAIQLLLEQQMPNISFVGCAATTSELLVWTHQKRPLLVVLDSHLPGVSLVTTLNLLLSQLPQLKVILLADYNEDRFMESCLRFGAFAYLTRPVQPTQLKQALSMATHALETLLEDNKHE
jgi:DNA-binding NarL/FixJ family response regulator